MRQGLRVILFTALASGLSAQTFTTLFTFDGTDGNWPGALTLGLDGNFYGATTYQAGTIFKITPGGALTTLYNLCPDGYNCLNGWGPSGALVQAEDGALYGTTSEGGAHNEGTVFKITPAGTLTTIYNFCAQPGCTDGAFPTSTLVLAADGNFYGTTQSGAPSSYCQFTDGCGTIYKITPGGELTTLYAFCAFSGCADGSIPYAMIQAADGNFYGVTGAGGSRDAGAIFKMTPDGELTTLYSFCATGRCADGSSPNSLIQATDGSFYGTTWYGGSPDHGSIFRFTLDGAFTSLYSFTCSGTACPDGINPQALIEASDSSFYGTTSSAGGQEGDEYGGTIFKITPDGTFTTLHQFCPEKCHSGLPVGPLVQATDGTLYGTTTAPSGTVYSLSLGLRPFVKPQPAAAKPGSIVEVLGPDLTGTTRVTFNGVAAGFQVMSSSFLVATVPATATDGQIQVTTPAGTLASYVPFHVLP